MSETGKAAVRAQFNHAEEKGGTPPPLSLSFFLKTLRAPRLSSIRPGVMLLKVRQFSPKSSVMGGLAFALRASLHPPPL